MLVLSPNLFPSLTVRSLRLHENKTKKSYDYLFLFCFYNKTLKRYFNKIVIKKDYRDNFGHNNHDATHANFLSVSQQFILCTMSI